MVISESSFEADNDVQTADIYTTANATSLTLAEPMMADVEEPYPEWYSSIGIQGGTLVFKGCPPGTSGRLLLKLPGGENQCVLKEDGVCQDTADSSSGGEQLRS